MRSRGELPRRSLSSARPWSSALEGWRFDRRRNMRRPWGEVLCLGSHYERAGIFSSGCAPLPVIRRCLFCLPT